VSDAPQRLRPKPPKTKARLEQLITQWQKDSGQPVARLNLRIAAMMLAGALARVTDPDGEGMFATKGGMAMQLRLGDRARATRDVDIVVRGDTDELADLLDAGLREPYGGFTFRRGVIDDLPTRPRVKKTRVQLSFAGRSFTPLQLEIAPLDTGEEEFTALPGPSLGAVGLTGPDVVMVLAERWQIAQKLHAVTETFPDGRENPRFRDLIDLQLLETFEPDLGSVRDACVRVFAARRQHEWPPNLAPQPSWSEAYKAMARELAFAVTDVDAAVRAVRSYIERIAAA
jgi:hypothetical protein